MRCMCGGTDFPSALRSSTVVPLRGGDRREDLPFERIIPGGLSDSSYCRPPGYRGCESKRGDDRCAQGNKHGSYVFVGSNQVTGGRIRTANTRKPRPPQRSRERSPFSIPKCLFQFPMSSRAFLSVLRSLCALDFLIFSFFSALIPASLRLCVESHPSNSGHPSEIASLNSDTYISYTMWSVVVPFTRTIPVRCGSYPARSRRRKFC